MDELRKKDTEELKKLLKETEEGLKDFRFSISGSKIKDVKKGRALRKTIARIKTLISGRS